MAHVDDGIAVSFLQLLAESKGISSCIVAGFLEHILDEELELSENEYPIIEICFGY